MKKYYLLLLLVILVGCSERELKFERTYPDTSRLDTIRAANKDVQQTTVDSEFAFLINSNTKPEQIDITVEGVDAGYASWPTNLCWSANYEECEDLKPIDVFSNTNFDVPYKSFKTKSKIMLTYYNMATVYNQLPTPDEIEVYTIDRDLTLTPYPYRKINEYTYEFTTPSDTTTTHMFMFKAIYKTKVGGVTYYPIAITGK